VNAGKAARGNHGTGASHDRHDHPRGNAGAAALLASFATPAQAGGILRIAMTASDVPTTTGAPDHGFEGLRFLG
jgi:hypothetical protein